MKIAILILGIIGAILFLLSVYSYMTSGKHFKTIAYSFLATAVAVFVLVIIKNLREQFGIGKDQNK